MIKLKCEICNYAYEVTEQELLDNANAHISCLMCGGQMVVGVEEVARHDIEQRAEEYLNQWIKERGLEGTVELIEGSPKNKIREIYMRKLRERGIIK